MFAPLDEAQLPLNQAESALGLLNDAERLDAARLLELCQDYWLRGIRGEEASREAGRLVELLARRSARAMPFAALGRALLADLYGSEKDRSALLLEFQAKLAMLGL